MQCDPIGYSTDLPGSVGTAFAMRDRRFSGRYQQRNAGHLAPRIHPYSALCPGTCWHPPLPCRCQSDAGRAA